MNNKKQSQLHKFLAFTKLNQWKLSIKVILLLATLVIMIVSSVLLSTMALKQTDQHFQNFIDGEIQLYSGTKDIYSYGLERGEAVRNLILWPFDPEAKNNLQLSIERSNNEFNKLIPLAKKYGVEKQILELQVLTSKDVKIQQQAATLVASNKDQAFDIITQDETPIWRVIQTKIDDLEQKEQQLFLEKGNFIHQQNASSLLKLYVFLFIFIVFSSIMYWFIRANVIIPITKISKQVKKIAHNDLTTEPYYFHSNDEVGQLAQDMNIMTENLRNLIHQIQHTSEQVATNTQHLSKGTNGITKSTEQISTTLQELALDTETQLKGTEENTKSMEEMTQGIQRIAESSSNVSNASIDAAKQTETGDQSVQSVIHQFNLIKNAAHSSSEIMNRFSDHSQQIGEITGVITTLAKQTNLLSLNASIEAARVGEHGKGFAVVADEIRKLAAQSDQSAKGISLIIENLQSDIAKGLDANMQSSKEVEAGVIQVNETGQALQHILHAVQQVAQQINEVSAASEEMSAGSEEISASMDEMAKAAHISAQKSQQMSAFSQQQLASIQDMDFSTNALNDVAQELKQLLTQFKV